MEICTAFGSHSLSEGWPLSANHNSKRSAHCPLLTAYWPNPFQPESNSTLCQEEVPSRVATTHCWSRGLVPASTWLVQHGVVVESTGSVGQIVSWRQEQHRPRHRESRMECWDRAAVPTVWLFRRTEDWWRWMFAKWKSRLPKLVFVAFHLDCYCRCRCCVHGFSKVYWQVNNIRITVF